MKFKSHSFSTELAKLIGLKESIILSHIYFWYEQNRSNNKNFHDGTWWTFNSVKTFATQFDYLSEKEIRGALKRLNDLGYTVEGCYNKMPMDKTKWYSLTEKAIKLLEPSPIIQKVKPIIQKGKWTAQKGEPIPDINTDSKHIYNTPISPKGDNSPFEEIDFSIDAWIAAYIRIFKDRGMVRITEDIDQVKLRRHYNKWVGMGRDPKEPLNALYKILSDNWQRAHNIPDASIPKLFNAEIVAKWNRGVSR